MNQQFINFTQKFTMCDEYVNDNIIINKTE